MIEIQVGNTIYYENKPYIVKQFLSEDKILIKDSEENYKVIKLIEIDQNDKNNNIPEDLNLIDKKLLNIAKKRYKIISPFLDQYKRSKKAIIERAKELNISYVTIYRWINLYESTNSIISLIPNFQQRGGKNKSRLPKEVVSIIDAMITERYLTKQKIPISKLHNEINAVLTKNNLKPICYNTLRNRIMQLDASYVFKKRHGSLKYTSQIKPAPEKYQAKYPLEIIQIDHTLLDIEVVDEKYRKPIGRPYITFAIDVYSRMIYSIYLSLEAPSFYSVGQALYLGFSPKDEYLKKLGVKGEWNIYGVPNTIHIDNAPEFRSEQLENVCELFEINIDFRPKKTPNYGGHVERFIKTLNYQIHTLQGTTFSNPLEKGEYNPQKKAIFTLREIEKYIIDWIINYYHNSPHEGINGKTPIQKFKEGILGDEDSPPTPLKILTNEELRVARISLLPYEKRTIQKTGVSLFGITYYDECLIPFMKPIPQNKKREKYIFRYDPNDLSKIYFYHPELKEYFEIPYKYSGYPPVSKKEIEEARKYLIKEKNRNINQTKLFETILRLRKMEEEAAEKTKLYRRKKEIKNTKKSKDERNNINQKDNLKHEITNFEIKKFDIFFDEDE